MKITSIEFLDVIQKDFKIESNENTVNNWQVGIFATIDKIEKDTFKQFIEVDILRKHPKNTASIKVINIYKIVNLDNTFSPISENDFWLYADLLQISLGHARLLFNQNLKGTELEGEYLRFENTQTHYINLKNGRYNLWN